MSGFSPDSVSSRGESEARTVLLTVVLPVLFMLGLLVWAVARLGGGL